MLEGLAVAAHGEFAVYAVGYVIVGRALLFCVGYAFEFEGVDEFVDSGDTGVVPNGVPLAQQRRGRQELGQGGQALSSIHGRNAIKVAAEKEPATRSPALRVRRRFGGKAIPEEGFMTSRCRRYG